MNNILGWIGTLLLLSTAVQAQGFSLGTTTAATQPTTTLERLSRPLDQQQPARLPLHNIEEAGSWRPGDIPTIAAQAGLGAASCIVAGFLSVPIAAVATRINVADGNTDAQLDAFFIITCLGASFGLAQGVIWGGDIFDGNGNGWLTLLGSVAGVTAGGLTGWHIHTAAGWMLGSAVVLATPILFYHLSAEPVYAGPASSLNAPAPTNHYSFRPTGMHDQMQLQVLSLPLDF